MSFVNLDRLLPLFESLVSKIIDSNSAASIVAYEEDFEVVMIPY